MFITLTNAETHQRHLVNTDYIISVYEVAHTIEPNAPEDAKTGVIYSSDNSALGFYASNDYDSVAFDIALNRAIDAGHGK